MILEKQNGKVKTNLLSVIVIRSLFLSLLHRLPPNKNEVRGKKFQILSIQKEVNRMNVNRIWNQVCVCLLV